MFCRCSINRYGFANNCNILAIDQGGVDSSGCCQSLTRGITLSVIQLKVVAEMSVS